MRDYENKENLPQIDNTVLGSDKLGFDLFNLR